ncbi:MAG: glycosyltransferase [Minisyncoccia bacterium]
MKKKILFVITKSNWGGAQHYVFDLATNLPKDTFDVAVVLGGTGEKNADSGLLQKKLKEAGVHTVFISSFVRDISLVDDFRLGVALLKLFRAEHPDVVHLNSSKAVVVGALAGRLAGVPRIIATVHGWAFNEQRPRWQKVILKLSHWIGAVLAHHTICVSEFDARKAAHWPLVAKKIVMIHNGITPMRLGPGEKIRSAFPSGAKITGTIGELTRNKNQIALIDEARKNSQMYVAIVGEGELRDFLDSKIKEYRLEKRVKLFGFLPAGEVLKGFDVFALPSLKEGLPYVLLEAKAAELPLIANPVGGIPEILDAQNMSEFSLERMVEKTATLYN